jgi:hypothetical protein
MLLLQTSCRFTLAITVQNCSESIYVLLKPKFFIPCLADPSGQNTRKEKQLYFFVDSKILNWNLYM